MTRPITNDKSAQYVTMKWLLGILTLAVLALTSAWAVERTQVDHKQDERLNIVEKRQAAVIEKLDNNKQLLDKIYDELLAHRSESSKR